MKHYDVLIVGAGHAGAQLAATLVQLKFDGSIAVIGEEPECPYERPPLSKDYLSGDLEFDRMLIRPEGFWTEYGIDMLTGLKVVGVAPGDRQVRCEGGEIFSYGKLVWAAGGHPRRLDCEGADLEGIQTVRTKADADAMKAQLDDIQNVVVVGGGYIGLEAAAVLRKLGKSVCLVEALDRVLARVAGEELSRFFESYHRKKGVDIRLNTGVSRFAGKKGGLSGLFSKKAGRVSGVVLSGGETIPADMVIVGIGIAPAVEPLLAAGLEGGNGVKVDGHCRTSDPNIYAIGDCALHANGYAHDEEIRLESVQNANDQARAVARTLTGTETGYDAVPWFWSNQYDLHLQTVGLSLGHDRTVMRGDPASGSFSLVYLREGVVIALDCVNATPDYAAGRKLVMKRVTPDLDQLADPTVPIKALLA